MPTKEANERLASKRQCAAAKIRELAPHVDTLIDLLDETKVDLLLIALCSETLPGD